MIEFFKRLFQPESSSVTARERLRLVLLSDHLALAPDVVESLKLDLIAVISKYVDVDTANCDVTFEQQESQVAMLANIPILGMKPAAKKPVAPPVPQAPPPMIDPSPASATVADVPEAVTVPDTTAVVEPVAKAAPKPRRRRRRRATVNAAPAHG